MKLADLVNMGLPKRMTTKLNARYYVEKQASLSAGCKDSSACQ